MGVGNILHSGYLSYLKNTDTLADSYTTVDEDEIILFTDDGEPKPLNSLFIENTGEAAIYVRPLPSEFLIYIEGGGSRSLDYVRCTGIQIMGTAGKTIRWSGCHY